MAETTAPVIKQIATPKLKNFHKSPKMINEKRIVPVEKTDLLSLYGLILKMGSNNATLAAALAATIDGDYEITEASTPLIADQPVKSVDFASDVSTATLYFVAAYDYVGFSINGTAVETTGDDVVADDNTLYKAELASSAIEITKVGF